MMEDIIVVRGGGDIATGTIQKLYRSGFKVLVLEIDKPTAIRRNVAFSDAVYNGNTTVEGIKASLAKNEYEINKNWDNKIIPIAVDSSGELINKIKPNIVIDAILAKKNMGTCKKMAPITIALGPGFNAGKDVDIVIETMRGHNLGKLIFEGSAIENTGVPGEIGGYSKERVIYSNNDGVIKNISNIGDIVEKGQVIALIGEENVLATISGILRGIIKDGTDVCKGLKIGDIDPRLKELENYNTISDKARSIGGGVLEAVLIMKNIKGL
ncbi:EF2563 family selenium-dependent molybdenum hydroxylase system protein [Clostridium gasigenes]|uniref:selenium-dependent molybdenum cofactor biosynthesis protein YqeB n=1 Tax=Clostridium gasigenes TaxID=94869 RepID=UPI001438372C|nr:selenium-dependent molybdenum cofactor biosynthesis protein YqeB [Clostridium gasigenes]NKF05558.1 EF2563 family selenium-dependent molybdenum hydroxylase system protein [Clostridium gasigenes]QSW19000.1 EF2563 family selenium-dependent molybdenum hydroxylase system protein [Clostridium gasigenes]